MNPPSTLLAEAPVADVASDAFGRDFAQGMKRIPKTIPCKYFYDERGSALFESICALPEYYPTRTESLILERYAGAMAMRAGPQCALVELGSGSSRKTRLILDRLVDPVAYVPVEISPSALDAAVRTLRHGYPALNIAPVCADYTLAGWRLPPVAAMAPRRLFFFPGSTIGNFTPDEAREFLRHLRHRALRGDAVVIGVDLIKPPAILEAAYDDRAGTTAAFNLNLLHRANRELGTDFNPRQFVHVASFNRRESRVEMQLLSSRNQTVHWGDIVIPFRTGEKITTEYSYKYRIKTFTELARTAGFTPAAVWADPHQLFSVHYLVV